MFVGTMTMEEFIKNFKFYDDPLVKLCGEDIAKERFKTGEVPKFYPEFLLSKSMFEFPIREFHFGYGEYLVVNRRFEFPLYDLTRSQKEKIIKNKNNLYYANHATNNPWN